MLKYVRLFGYDQGVMSGLLTLPTFVATFPEVDTTSSSLSVSEKQSNSTLQGVSVWVTVNIIFNLTNHKAWSLHMNTSVSCLVIRSIYEIGICLLFWITWIQWSHWHSILNATSEQAACLALYRAFMEEIDWVEERLSFSVQSSWSSELASKVPPSV